jgi:hypothetical protein
VPVRADVCFFCCPEVTLDAHKGTRYMPCHSCSLARACDRPQPFPMSMCGVAATRATVPDLLSVCLQLFLYASNGIDSKMRTTHPLRQAACCELVHFESPFWCRFEPLPRLPPTCPFALAGVIRSQGV